MKKVNCFEAIDKKIFRCEDEALKHESRLKAVHYFNDKGYYGPTGSFCGEDIVEFIEEHAEVIKSII